MPINPSYTQEQKNALAARLRLFRENFPMPYTDKRCSQEDVARALNISRSNYTYFEQGKTIPNIFLLQKLAAFYEVSVDELIGNPVSGTGGFNGNEKNLGNKPFFKPTSFIYK